MIQTQIRRDVNAERTNMAAGNSSISAKMEYADICHVTTYKDR